MMFATGTSFAARFSDGDLWLFALSGCAAIGFAFATGFAQDSGKRASQALAEWIGRQLDNRARRRAAGRRRIGF